MAAGKRPPERRNLMIDIGQAIKMAAAEYKKEFGQEAQLKNGEAFASLFNNGVLVVSNNNGKIGFHFIGGEPYKIDAELDIYEG